MPKTIPHQPAMFDPAPVAERPAAPVIEVPQPAALVRRERHEEADPEGGSVAVLEANFLDYAAGGEDGIRRFERAVDLLGRARAAALKLTGPRDWVLTRDRSGATSAYLAGTGIGQLVQLFGVSLRVWPVGDDGRFAPAKITEDLPKGVHALRCWCEGYSALTGRRIIVEATRRSDEDFAGRQTDDDGKLARRGAKANEGDLRCAVFTLAQAKAVRALTGLQGVTAEELTSAGINVEHCRQGQGYGSATEREAGRVAPEDVKAAANALGEDILKRVGGDVSAAASLLKECTSKPASGKSKGFEGFASVGRLTEQWQIDNARKRLKAHPTFGDAAADAGEGG
jgi:hypothetical protein